MIGVILAAGYGTRLRPFTKLLPKPLLPIFNKPMISFPINTLKQSGIKDIVIVVLPEHKQLFETIIGDGSLFGVDIHYVLQHDAKGTAQALSLVKKYTKDNIMVVCNGDNIFEAKIDLSTFTTGAHLIVREDATPEKFGVVSVNENQVTQIEEKPTNPTSKLIVTGMYAVDSTVFDKIATIQTSLRGELEITDVFKQYIAEKKCTYTKVEGFWSDAGTFESLLESSNWANNGNTRNT
ncbi:MAG: glucose-1-phosphate thymidylyltransferase [Candidatus Woesearchaeota archaeon]|jgi:glucose-1-phosphate thymidylyltransferase